MGGFFGITSKKDCLLDVFFGVDYHSHLSARRGGIAAYDKERGLQRSIHNIESAPFRTKFADVFDEMKGNSAIGCISDTDPQPLLIRSNLGNYAICTIGVINNAEQLVAKYLKEGGGYFCSMTGGVINATELVAAMINTKDNFADGIEFAQSVIDGTVNVLILRDDGSIIAARDKVGRLPVRIGKSKNGYCVAFENFSYLKLEYKDEKELGPGEIVQVTPTGLTILKEKRSEMKVCAFLWSYFGYPTATYEGVNVEVMRNRNGRILARYDRERNKLPSLDYVSGVPDSGTPHALGYAYESGVPFARPYIKYTPTWSRSFTSPRQAEREKVAKMKQIPVHELIENKELLFVDDSIVRGTQIKETVDFLYSHGAKAVHMRSACPPIMYGCKYLNFSRSTSNMDLITRRVIMEIEGEEGFKYIEEYSNGDTERGKKLREVIANKFNFASLDFQSLDGLIEAIGLPKCKVCTYCWNGEE